MSAPGPRRLDVTAAALTLSRRPAGVAVRDLGDLRADHLGALARRRLPMRGAAAAVEQVWIAAWAADRDEIVLRAALVRGRRSRGRRREADVCDHPAGGLHRLAIE